MKPNICLNLICSLAMAAAAASCSSTSPVEEMDEAQTYIDNGDTESAQQIYDGLLSRSDSDKVGARAYAQLSIAYVRLTEVSDQPDNIANAAVCYRRAFNLDPDSARVYYASLVGDDAMRYAMLAPIASAYGQPTEIMAFENDSITISLPDSI